MLPLHIEVVRYVGKNGSYATHMTPLWIARIVGVDGRRRNCDQNTWHGTGKTYAMSAAQDWAVLLGCEIVVWDNGDSPTPGGMPPSEKPA